MTEINAYGDKKKKNKINQLIVKPRSHTFQTTKKMAVTDAEVDEFLQSTLLPILKGVMGPFKKNNDY